MLLLVLGQPENTDQRQIFKVSLTAAEVATLYGAEKP